MGVAGCGKTTVGRRIAQQLQQPFYDGDDYHGENNRRKMADGRPLTDEDRHPWLARLGDLMQLHPGGCVISCSALKRAYRDLLREQSPVRFLYLEISEQTARQRVAGRDHFFPLSLVADQFAVLESPGNEPGVVTVDGETGLESVVEAAVSQLRESA